MDNVLNRPLFRHREARDRLNDIAGVQRFAPGGFVRADPSGAIVRQYSQRPVRPVGLPSLPSASAGENLSNLRGFQLANAELAAAEEEVQRLQQAFAEEPTGENLERYKQGLAALEQQRQITEGVRGSFVPGSLGVIEPDRGVLAAEGPEAMVAQMSPEQLDIFNNLGRAAEAAAPVPTGPSGMEQEARGRRPSALAPSAPGEGIIPTGPSGMEQEARGRGPMITSPAEVAAGLNAEDPAVREKTVADFMQEFTALAPKYEGTDKNLMLAQIGFAIAAGESPNAMQNIANGLLAGSQAMIKDRAAKDEFDRQLQLSAMQYGLQEMGKQREASRTGSFFVAAKPVTIGGRKYQPGESVFVSSATIAKDGVPQGLTTEAMADAVARNKAAVDKALIEARDAKNISVSEFNSLNEKLNLAAESFESNRALRPLVEASLVRAADGKVTGASSFFIEMANKAANSVGVDLGRAYEDPEKYKKDMLKVGNRLIQEILRESGRTVSNVDRDLVAQMVGQINDVQAQVTTDPDILVGTLQDILNVIDQNERAALEQYRTVTEATAGLYSPSGAPLELSARATRVFENTAPIDMEDLFSYDEATGIWKPKVQ